MSFDQGKGVAGAKERRGMKQEGTEEWRKGKRVEEVGCGWMGRREVGFQTFVRTHRSRFRCDRPKAALFSFVLAVWGREESG